MDNDRIAAQCDVIAQLKPTNDNRAETHIQIITDHRNGICLSAVADAVISMKTAVFADPCILIDDDASVVIDGQTGAKTIFRDLEAQPVAQHIFPAEAVQVSELAEKGSAGVEVVFFFS